MEFKKFKNNLKRKLSEHSIAESEVDDILSYVLGMEKKDLFLLESIDKKQMKLANKIVGKRLKHIPLEKQFQTAYFYGEKFCVNNNVLTPRQDTEILVEKALGIIKDGDSVLDLCTGSGIIAITIAMNKSVQVVASDISVKAIRVAKKNAKSHNVKIDFEISNLFDKIENKFDVIVSNPPYIESNVVDTLDDEVKLFDPRTALDGGKDGLMFYEKIIGSAKQYLKEKGSILFEIGFNQAESVCDILKRNHFCQIEVIKDYGNNPRVVSAKLI